MISLKNKIVFWVLTIGLLALSSIHFNNAMVDGRSAFFGDTGDGLFNVWIMEHNYQNVKNGNFKLFDGRVFQPETKKNTVLWSDNLFVPTIFYGCFRLIVNPLTASYYTGILLSIISYLSYLLMFFIIFRIINDFHRKLPQWSLFLIPFFTYIVNFSISKFEYYSHFQNLAFCFSVSLFACMLGYFFYKRRVFFAGMLFSEVALLYSSPYFAVLGLCFVLCWFIVQASVDWKDLFVIFRENLVSIIIAGGLFGFLAFHYMLVDKMEYGIWVFRMYRAKFEELYIAQCGLFQSWFKWANLHDSPESPTYLGLGLVIGLILLIMFVLIPYIIKFIKSNYKNYFLYVLVILIILYRAFLLPIRENDIVAIVGLILWVVVLAFIFFKLVNREEKQSIENMFALLVMGTIFCYGIAFGPSKYFLETSLNPSVWGFVYKFIPGGNAIRAVGRMCVPGQGLLFAIVFASVLMLISDSRKKIRIGTICFVVLCLCFQIAETSTVKPTTEYRYSNMVVPTEDEADFFNAHSGLYLLVPTTPWHKNSLGMIFFTQFQNINLMNGYSAKSTTTWDRIMNAENDYGPLSQEVVSIAKKHGCDYIVVLKSRIYKFSYQRHIKPLNIKVVFNNDRLAVLSL